LFVARQPEKRARAEQMLGELAELALMMARELAVRVRESEDPAETVALAAAFQKTSRVVRLTLALDFKLERDAAREAQDLAREAEAAKAAEPRPAAPSPPVNTTARRIEHRKMRVCNLLKRLLWTESEGDRDDYEVLYDDLSARLDEAALNPDFEGLPVEALTLSLCETSVPESGEPSQPPQPNSS